MAETRTEVTLCCTVCGNENYITSKNKRLHPDRFEVKKFCAHCNKETMHKEKR